MRRRAAAARGVGVVMLLAGCAASPPVGPDPPTAERSPAEPADLADLADLADVVDRAAHTMTPVPGGGLLVAGGCTVDGCTSATSTSYVVGPAGVRRVADLGSARDAHTATPLADGRVLVTGGFEGEGRPPLASAEVYDPVTRAWREVGPLAVGRGGHAAAPLADGRVLVAGGWVGPGAFTATTEIFDPGTDSFLPGPDLPVAVDGLAAAGLPDGSALVVGGQAEDGVATDLAVVITADGRSTEVGPLGTARFKHALVTLDSGRVLAVGGTPDDRRLLRSTEVFDPASRSFLPGPTLRQGRYKLAGSVVALPDGRVVVAGGGPGVEVVDVADGRSRPVAGLGGGRASFSTVGVTGGRLVVLGGYDERIRLVRTGHALPVAGLSGR